MNKSAPFVFIRERRFIRYQFAMFKNTRLSYIFLFLCYNTITIVLKIQTKYGERGK
jgi:hypothetical protein